MGMDRQHILNEIQTVMQDLFDDFDGTITEATTAENVEQWDSLANVQLMVRLEQKLKLRFTAAEIAGLANVGELVSLINKKTSA
jgi:acyl carrier protein